MKTSEVKQSTELSNLSVSSAIDVKSMTSYDDVIVSSKLRPCFHYTG